MDSRTVGQSDGFSRRTFLVAAASLVLPLRSVQDSVARGTIYDPYRAGRPQTPTTPMDSDPGVQVLEKRLKCTCPCNLDVYTCRTTDFTCTYSPAMHREVLALLEQGMSADQVVDDFVRRYGQKILMAPPRRGFNLAGYFVPSLAVLAAAAVLVVVLRRWTRVSAPVPAVAASAAAPAGVTAAELERLRAELDDFDA